MLRLSTSTLKRLFALVFFIVVIAALFRFFIPVYLDKTNFLALLRAMSINGIVALGLTFVIVTLKFDLSLAGIASLSAMALGFTLSVTDSLLYTFLAAIGTGALCGLINGLLVGKGRLPDVVTTIATGSIAYGLAFGFNGGADYSKNFFSSGMVMINYKTIFGVQVPVFIFLITLIISGYILHATRYGRNLYATGENPIATYFSGINEKASIALAFTLCGMMVGLAMVLHVSGVGSSRVTAGSQILLPAYTSVYLGAALIGRTSVLATLSGVLIMTMLLNGFTLLGFPYYYSDAVVSIILISAISLFDPKAFKILRKSLSFHKMTRRR